MQFRTPLSDPAQHAAGGAWDATTQGALNANFPSAAHWFPCKEAAGATSWTDVNGVIVPATIAAGSTTGSIDPGVVTNVTPTAGTFYRPSVANVATYKAFIMMAVSNGAVAAGIGIGALLTGTNARASAMSQTSGPALHDGTNTITSGGALTVNAVMGWGSVVDFTANIRGFTHTTGGTYTMQAGAAVSAATPASLASGVDNIPNAITVSSGITDICGFLILRLAAMPSNTFLQNMIAWHTWAWSNNKKWLYPGLKGLT